MLKASGKSSGPPVVGAHLTSLALPGKPESVVSLTSQCSYSSTIVHVGDKKTQPELGRIFINIYFFKMASASKFKFETCEQLMSAHDLHFFPAKVALGNGINRDGMCNLKLAAKL